MPQASRTKKDPTPVVCRRLEGLGLLEPNGVSPADVVSRLVAVQAQDFAGAKWSLGLRMPGAVDDTIERAFADGAILRTHVMRPTWHFVTPADIRWLLALTAPRVNAANGPRYRQLDLDTATFVRAERVFARELRGREPRTRAELGAALTRAGIDVSHSQRLVYILMHAELSAAICSGPRRGTHTTYAWLDDRVAPGHAVTARHVLLATLAERYVASRGPASVHDFAKWSGLTVAEARDGLHAIEASLTRVDDDGGEQWCTRSASLSAPQTPVAHLLSVFDELLSSYRDRASLCHPTAAPRLEALGAGVGYVMVLDGQVVGLWRRTFRARRVEIRLEPCVPLGRLERARFEACAERYGRFVGLPVDLEIVRAAG